MMSNEQSISSHLHLRGIEYVILMMYGEEISHNFTIEVLDNGTLDVWCGTFDAEYIENLTHKTGNFKQFSIFSNMLKTALLKQSESVTLDLLTYADLEQLRLQRSGNRANAEKQPTANLNSKRYLILTYTVEFDRIHYPLPLHQKPTPNNTSLQQIIVNLRSEVKQLKDELKHKPKDLEKVKDYRTDIPDNEELAVNWANYQLEKTAGINGNSNSKEISTQKTASGTKKEIHLLKAVVKKLEMELLREKTRHQHIVRKKTQELSDLQQEVRQLRSSERQLRIRMKSLTNELAAYKRNRNNSARSSRYEQSSSCESLNCMSLRNRSSSRERNSSCERPTIHRKQSNSRERKCSSRDTVYSRCHDNLNSSRNSGNSTGSQKNYRSRTPSPYTTFRRFDPTAYIKEQERKKEESQNNCRKSGKSTNRSQKLYKCQRKVDRSGDSSDGGLSDYSSSSYYRTRHRPPAKYVHSPSPKENPKDCIRSVKNKYLSSKLLHPQTRKSQKVDSIDQSLEICEVNDLEKSLEIGDIDAKLKLLQQQLLKSGIS